MTAATYPSAETDFDAIILGAGAAGLFCAAQAGQLGLKVLLIDHAEKVAEKIRISGGGRCNFTNRDLDVRAPHKHYVGQNPSFAALRCLAIRLTTSLPCWTSTALPMKKSTRGSCLPAVVPRTSFRCSWRNARRVTYSAGSRAA